MSSNTYNKIARLWDIFYLKKEQKHSLIWNLKNVFLIILIRKLTLDSQK